MFSFLEIFQGNEFFPDQLLQSLLFLRKFIWSRFWLWLNCHFKGESEGYGITESMWTKITWRDSHLFETTRIAPGWWDFPKLLGKYWIPAFLAPEMLRYNKLLLSTISPWAHGVISCLFEPDFLGRIRLTWIFVSVNWRHFINFFCPLATSWLCSFLQIFQK